VGRGPRLPASRGRGGLGLRPEVGEAGGKRKKEKEKGEKGKEKEEKKKENRKKEKNQGREIEKGFRKLGEFLEKLGEGVLRIFLGFSDTGVNSGTAVMSRRTGQRDRGMRGILGTVADYGAGVARAGAGLSAGGAGGIRGTRAGVRGRYSD
jgi:hypothetical protein